MAVIAEPARDPGRKVAPTGGGEGFELQSLRTAALIGAASFAAAALCVSWWNPSLRATSIAGLALPLAWKLGSLPSTWLARLLTSIAVAAAASIVISIPATRMFPDPPVVPAPTSERAEVTAPPPTTTVARLATPPSTTDARAVDAATPSCEPHPQDFGNATRLYNVGLDFFDGSDSGFFCGSDDVKTYVFENPTWSLVRIYASETDADGSSVAPYIESSYPEDASPGQVHTHRRTDRLGEAVDAGTVYVVLRCRLCGPDRVPYTVRAQGSSLGSKSD